MSNRVSSTSSLTLNGTLGGRNSCVSQRDEGALHSQGPATGSEDDGQWNAMQRSGHMPKSERAGTGARRHHQSLAVHADTGYDDDHPVDKLWTDCAGLLWEHEQRRIDKWDKELDAMLAFATIFSAVVTAFAAGYYTNLGPQAASNIAVLLATQSSGQPGNLGNKSADISAMHSLTPIVADSTSHALLVDSVSILFFVALVLSLVAASIAIYVKQWLNQHSTPNSVLGIPRNSVLIWYWRRKSFYKWRVEIFISLVPILLQSSLIIYLIGLVLLLRPLNTAVFAITAAVVLLLLIYSVVIAVLPALDVHCPYKSPQALLVIDIKTFVCHLLDLPFKVFLYFQHLRPKPDSSRFKYSMSDLWEFLGRGKSTDDDKERLSDTSSIQYRRSRWSLYKDLATVLTGCHHYLSRTKYYSTWSKFDDRALDHSSARTVVDWQLLELADTTLILEHASSFMRLVLLPYLRHKGPEEGALVLIKIQERRIADGLSHSGHDSGTSTTKFERMVGEIIDRLAQEDESRPSDFSPELCKMIDQLLSDTTPRYRIFHSLLDYLRKVKYHNVFASGTDEVLRLVLDHVERFKHRLEQDDYSLLMYFLPYAARASDVRVLVKTTVEMLMLSDDAGKGYVIRGPLHEHLRALRKEMLLAQGDTHSRAPLEADEIGTPSSILNECIDIAIQIANEHLGRLHHELHTRAANGLLHLHHRFALEAEIGVLNEQLSGFKYWSQHIEEIPKIFKFMHYEVDQHAQNKVNKTEVTQRMNEFAIHLPKLFISKDDVDRLLTPFALHHEQQ